MPALSKKRPRLSQEQVKQITDEGLLPIAEAFLVLPRASRPRNLTQLASRGCKGADGQQTWPEVVRVCGRSMTSEKAVLRFVAKLN